MNSKVFEVPIRDFEDLNGAFSELACLINLDFNPNLASEEEWIAELKELERLKESAKKYFTAEDWTPDTSQRDF